MNPGYTYMRKGFVLIIDNVYGPEQIKQCAWRRKECID